MPPRQGRTVCGGQGREALGNIGGDPSGRAEAAADIGLAQSHRHRLPLLGGEARPRRIEAHDGLGALGERRKVAMALERSLQVAPQI